VRGHLRLLQPNAFSARAHRNVSTTLRHWFRKFYVAFTACSDGNGAPGRLMIGMWLTNGFRPQSHELIAAPLEHRCEGRGSRVDRVQHHALRRSRGHRWAGDEALRSTGVNFSALLECSDDQRVSDRRLGHPNGLYLAPPASRPARAQGAQEPEVSRLGNRDPLTLAVASALE
jgi:hypothetical protein